MSRFDARGAAGARPRAIETLARYDTAWRERAAAHGDACLATLARYADVETAAVVLRRENTPLDIEQRLVTMHRGSYKHGAYTSLQLGYLRPNDQCSCNETPIEGLFVGGARRTRRHDPRRPRLSGRRHHGRISGRHDADGVQGAGQPRVIDGQAHP